MKSTSRFILAKTTLPGIILGLLFAFAGPTARGDDDPPCRDMQACIRAIPSAAAPGPGINKQAQRLAKAIHAYGGAAIPGLLPYLKDKNDNVRAVASYILSSQDGLREEHLQALIESRLRGDDWIPRAIARIGTPKAIAFLVSELKKKPDTELTWAFKVLGAKAGPPLVELYRCGARCDEHLLESCEFIFGELKEQASAVVPDLAAIALDKTQPLIARRAAVISLGNIGPAASSAAPDILTLAGREPAEFGDTVDQALLEMRHPAAVRGILKRIELGKTIAFADLASLGQAGQSAGPSILMYLNDPERAVYAARTFGSIGYSDATGPLVHLLDSDDWRVVYVACVSLGNLKAAAARPELERVMNTHWYPPVREAAKRAISAIDGKEELKAESDRELWVSFYAFEHAGEALCKHWNFGAQTREPALKVPNGLLVGTNHGEWDGELSFVEDSTHENHLILKDNIMGIFQVGPRVLAIGGLAHLSGNRGVVYEIEHDGNHYSASVWRHLPGAPSRGELQGDGRLLVYTYGGAVYLSADGKMEMAPCEP